MIGWAVGAIACALSPTPPSPEPREESQATEPADPDPAMSRRGERWRPTWMLTTHGSFVLVDYWTLGIGLVGYAGVGVPVRSRPGLRQEHGFGVDYQWTAAFSLALLHRLRLAAPGLVGGRDALFYQAALGWHGDNPLYYPGRQGASVGGKLGLAAGNRVNLIFAAGIDIDFSSDADYLFPAALVFSVSLLNVGAL